ncbi:polyketide synthase [Aspergillus luchuensis]|uniref:Polyketide synthase n=1 Tax=Aspergillus kawachii TaxID=1069201 RepID=A0A146FY95_ASPKA|nr:polyketide synthase [Aspergillus luchuensis]
MSSIILTKHFGSSEDKHHLKHIDHSVGAVAAGPGLCSERATHKDTRWRIDNLIELHNRENYETEEA